MMTVREQHQASLTRDYVRADGREVIGGFASADLGGVIVGVEVPRTAAYLASRGLLKNLLLVAFGLLVLATVAGLFWANRITRPMERLSGATRKIAKGDFGNFIGVCCTSEMFRISHLS